jgi:hypothetical protein
MSIYSSPETANSVTLFLKKMQFWAVESLKTNMEPGIEAYFLANFAVLD